MQVIDKKKIILKALAKVVKDLRGKKSQFMLASENDISTSILSTIEREMKDPQLTTMFKLAEAFNLNITEFMQLISAELPDNFYLIER